jgi:predicted Zn-dependent peptidase
MNRTIAPAILQTKDLDLQLKNPKLTVLDNGIKIYTLDAGSQDVLLLDFVWEAGNVYETKPLISGAVSHLLKSGTHYKTAFEINESFEFYGAYLNRAAGAEYANVTLHTLSKHALALLPIVAELLYDSTLPQKELDIFIQQRLQQLAMSLQKSDFVANRTIDKLLYGAEHPYGMHSTADAYKAITQEDCAAFYEKHYIQSPFTLYIGGKVPVGLLDQINTLFGSRAFRFTTHNRQYKYAPATELKHRIMNDQKAVQGSIRLARPFFNRKHEDFKACMVLNTLFGGFFGSRLMSNIREDKGYTYGIHSHVQGHLNQTAWIISTDAGKDVCEAAINEVWYEMDRLKSELVDEEELQLVQNYMVGQVLGDLDGPFHLVNRWKIYHHNEVDGQSYFNDYLNTIRSITPEQLQAFAKKYLNKEEFYDVIVY